MASRADVQAWSEDHPDGNIGLRLPPTVIGVDVDAHKGYAEAAAWQDLTGRLGPLPEDAPWCTSRDDGISGIRLFAVPEGYEPRDMGLAGETIWHGYRYVIAPPSIHQDTGKTYRWVNTGGKIPRVDELPPLPPVWLEHLRAGHRPGGQRETTWTDPEIDALIEHGITGGNQDYQLRDVVWKLRTRDTSRTQARVVWLAIVAKTPVLKRGQPWTEQDFDRHWDGADQKLTHPQHPQFQQPGQRPRVSDSVSDKITDDRALTSVSDTSDSTDDEQLLGGIRDGAWLTAQQFPPLRYAIPGLIPEGFTLLIGAPKIGKSWMVLDFLLAVASGGRALGHIAAGDPRPVLYLAMEDSDRRMQDRCRQLLREAEIPPAFSYQTQIVPGQVLRTIAAWMRRAGDTALVVIDTLGKVMPPAMMGESHYQRDYRIGSAIKALADANPGLAIVVNHHDRKASAEDFIDSVSGTHGLAGAADTVAVLARKRQSDEGALKITGRDVPEDEYALTITDGMAWQLAGPTLASAAGEATRRAADMNMSATMTDVRKFITSHPGGIRAKDVADKFGKDAYQYLGRLVDMGHIEKLGRGFYVPVSEVSEVSESQVSDPAVSDSESDAVRNENEQAAVALLEDKLGGQVLAWPEDSYGEEAQR
jgi:hypothetical protein